MFQLNQIKPLAAPMGRTMISAIFVMSGLNKITNYAGTSGYMESMGVPGGILPLVIFTEVVFGLMVILGWNTKLAAFALAGFSIFSAFLFHNNFADQNEIANFMKNIAIAGGFFILVAHGAGAYALDNRKA